MQDNIGGLPSDMTGILGLLGLDKGLNIIISTLVWTTTYKGLSGARSYRSSWRKPTTFGG
ncbi:DUF2523 family protein [Salinivibrio sp. IB872]|uniref:DUF2523 family protein n=1 Tax=Salinivibrio sp. IB872 TaxID=1766123 RepID=UPI000D52E5ED